MLIMAAITHQETKQYHIDSKLSFPISKSIKRLRDYDEHEQLFTSKWSLEHRRKVQRINDGREEEQQYHCNVYLKLFPSTLKCSIDVIVKSINKPDVIVNDDNDIL